MSGGNLVDDIHLPVQSGSMAMQNHEEQLFTSVLDRAVRCTKTKKWSLNGELIEVVSDQEVGVLK